MEIFVSNVLDIFKQIACLVFCIIKVIVYASGTPNSHLQIKGNWIKLDKNKPRTIKVQAYHELKAAV